MKSGTNEQPIKYRKEGAGFVVARKFFLPIASCVYGRVSGAIFCGGHSVN